MDACLQELFASFEGESLRARRAAVAAVRKQSPGAKDEVFDALLKRLYDTDRHARWDAAWALGKIGSKRSDVLDALVVALENDGAALVRWEAAEALGQIGLGRRDVLDALLAAMKNECPYVRAEVSAALGQLAPSPRDVVDALAPAHEDRHPYVRWNIAWALGQIYGGRDAVLDALAALRKDDCDDVRSAARRAFRAVEALPERTRQWQPVSIGRGG
jgi:HEAT repeat protein